MSLNNCSFFSVKCVLIHTKVIKILHKTLLVKYFLAFTSLFFLEMSRNDTPKMQRMILKVKEMTFKSIGWHPEWHPKKRMNSLLLKQTYEMIVWGVNKRLLSKRKIRWYTIAMKVLLFSSFEKQKEYIWHFSETRIKR